MNNSKAAKNSMLLTIYIQFVLYINKLYLNQRHHRLQT